MGDYYGHGGGKPPSTNSGGGGMFKKPSEHQQQQQQQQQQSTNVNLDAGKIFVGGLSWQTTEESLRWHFEQYGPVHSVDVMRDRQTGDPRGFAFVVFNDQETVDLVMETTHEINHKVVDVKRAQARGIAPPSIHHGPGAPEGAPMGSPGTAPAAAPSPSGGGGGGGGGGGSGDQNKVFVGGIPPHIDRDGLRALLEPFGPVTDAIVMMDQATQRSRCFGFVAFAHDSGGAVKAVAAQPLHVDGRRVEVKLATPRGNNDGGGGGAPNNGGGGHQQNQHGHNQQQQRHGHMPPPASLNVGLRAGVSATTTGPYAGLAVAYGRSGWKAGYGSYAFGKAGWAVQGWGDDEVTDNDDNDNDPSAPVHERYGFSFPKKQSLQQHAGKQENGQPPPKRQRH